MKLSINKETTIEDLQNAFNDAYPFLRIVFLNTTAATTINQRVTQKKFLTGNMYRFLTGKTASYFIDISMHKTVAEVENDCYAIGVKAQILRKSCNVWIATALTRNWTLERQNHEGEMLDFAV
jgi:hypothetical protein